MGDHYYLSGGGSRIYTHKYDIFRFNLKDEINNKFFTKRAITKLARIQDSITMKEPKYKKDILELVNAIIKINSYKLKNEIFPADQSFWIQRKAEYLKEVKKVLESSKHNYKYLYLFEGTDNDIVNTDQAIMKLANKKYSELNKLTTFKIIIKHWKDGSEFIKDLDFIRRYENIIYRDLGLNFPRIINSYNNINKAITIFVSTNPKTKNKYEEIYWKLYKKYIKTHYKIKDKIIRLKDDIRYSKYIQNMKKHSKDSGWVWQSRHMSTEIDFGGRSVNDTKNAIEKILINSPNYIEKLVNNWIKLAEYAYKYPDKIKYKHIVATFMIGFFTEILNEKENKEYVRFGYERRMRIKSWIDNEQKNKIKELMKKIES